MLLVTGLLIIKVNTFLTILSISIVVGILFGDWRDWFKSEDEKEYEREEMGWLLGKVVDILVWIGTLYIILSAFLIIKVLWKLA